MKKEKAEQLVNKLRNAAFMAGNYSGNHESLIFNAETAKALELSAEIVRHLTSAIHSDGEGRCDCPVQGFTVFHKPGCEYYE